MTRDYGTLISEIGALIEAPLGDQAPTLDAIERTLTDGYAEALSLEADQWRLERRIDEIVARIKDRSGDPDTDELASLSLQLSSAAGQLESLRSLLASLRARAAATRAA